ncbi:MAG: HAMP domain-containing sensor histidine kinase [Ktedonobacterales bacterium]
MKMSLKMPLSLRAGAAEHGLGWRLRIGLRWLALTAILCAVTALALTVALRPSPAHAMQIALYLAVSGVVSVALGQLALWLADAAQVGSVWLRLILPPTLTTLVIAFNVELIAHMMFIASEDGQLLVGFLVFGAAVALLLAFSIAQEMTRAIQRIETGARRIADGDYGYRLAEEQSGGGAVELSRLAGWFNSMAASVQEAFARRQAAETERRQVIAAVSHDLRTPLASVRAMIEAIDDGVVTDAVTVRRYQRAIRAEVRHLSALMDDLFDLSRLESGAFTLSRERLALDDLLSDALEAIQTQAEGQGVRLEGRVEGALPLVSVDARQLHRVLTNLLQNALRYTPQGGAILLHATATLGEDDAHLARVAVLDSGAGIAADDLPHIFERTYRGEASRQRAISGPGDVVDATVDGAGVAADAHEAQRRPAHPLPSGAGLGLTIARGIVEAHGGTISALSPLPADLRAQLDPLCVAHGGEHDDRDAYQGTALIFTLPAMEG